MQTVEDNTKILERFFEKYDFSVKDRYEITQIYSILPEEKQKNVLLNFDTLALKIQKIGQELHDEQEILIGESLETIRMAVKNAKIRKGL